MHFFTQSLSSFHSICPYHRSLFCCNTSAMSSIPVPNLSLSSLLGNLSFSLTPYIHLTILISVFFPYGPGLTSMQHTASHATRLLYNFPLIINDTPLLVSSGTISAVYILHSSFTTYWENYSSVVYEGICLQCFDAVCGIWRLLMDGKVLWHGRCRSQVTWCIFKNWEITA